MKSFLNVLIKRSYLHTTATQKNSKQTLKDTSSTIDLIGGFSWKVAVRYIGEAGAERKGGLYRGALFRHYI